MIANVNSNLPAKLEKFKKVEEKLLLLYNNCGLETKFAQLNVAPVNFNPFCQLILTRDDGATNSTEFACVAY